jgi:hypothetical protein
VKARFRLYAGGLLTLITRLAVADPWSTTPRVGISGDYESNPGLHTIDVASEEHVAAIFNVPLTYNVDNIECAVTGAGRISNATGYSSLASNYFHLDAVSQFSNDRSTASLQAHLARDSSLYFIGGLVNGIGVRRDTESTTGDYTYSVSPRNQLQLDASWSQVRFDQPPNLTGLLDYRYLSVGPTYAYLLTERDTLKLLGNYGHYESLNGQTKSNSENVQVAYVRQLAELWTLSTSAGYSRAQNTQTVDIFIPPFFFVPETVKSNQNGAVYSVSLTRQGDRLTLSAGISQALQPAGFAYLLREDSYTVSATFLQSERWDYQLSANLQKGPEPGANGPVSSQRYIFAEATANWHWSAQWLLSFHAIRVSNRYGNPGVSPSSNEVSVDIVRQFLRTDL